MFKSLVFDVVLEGVWHQARKQTQEEDHLAFSFLAL